MARFCDAMGKFGRDNLAQIASMLPDKTLDEVTGYHTVFWSRGPSELRDFDRHIAALERNKAIAEKEKTMGPAFQWKMESYRHPEIELSIKYYTKSHYTKEHDQYILSALYKYGFDNPMAYVRIRQDIM